MPVNSKITGAPFRFWCQKVLPAVYDDSLSYYELLCKVVDYLNKVMEDDINVVNLVNELEEFVNDYFTNLNVQNEINNKLDAMAEDGSLLAVVAPHLDEIIAEYEATLDADLVEYKETIDADITEFKGTVNNELDAQYTDIANFKNTVNAQVSAQNTEISDFKTNVNASILEQDNDISVMQSQMSNFIDSHSDVQTFTTLFESTEQNGGHYEGQSIVLTNPYTDYTELDIYWSYLGDVRVTRVASADVLANGVIISWFADSPVLQPSSPAPLNIPLMSLINGNNDHTALTIGTAYAETWTGLSTDSAVRNSASTSTDYDAGSIIKIIGVKYQASAELQDIRVGADGTIYDSAGNAVRGQLSYLKSDIIYNNNGKQTFKGMANFQHYGLNPDATFMTSQTYRVSNDDPITLPYAAKLNIKTGFKFGYIPVYDGTPGSWKGWYTSEITIPYGVSFVLQIARVQENTGETASVEEFLTALYFNSVSDYLIELTEKEKNADFYRTFNSFEHERGTIKTDGSDDDSEYNMPRKIRSVGNVYLNKGDTITPTNNMRALAIGVNLVETSENIITGWFQTEYTIQYSGYYRIIISVVGDFVINDKDITKVCDYVELRTNLIEQMYNVYEYAKTNIPFGRKFEYSGEYLNLNKKSYDIQEVLPVLPSQPTGGIALQAAEYYNGVMFLFYSGGVVTLMDYETGNVITSYETGTEHGNSACFSNVFYDSSDEFPLLYVGSDNANNDIYVIRVSRTAAQTIRKLRLPVNSAGYHASNCAVDNLNNVLWTTGYYLNDYETEAGNYMKLCSWDLSTLTDNGDNTYTPELKEVTALPFIDTTQDEKIMNGNLYIISSNPLAGAQGRKTKIYVVSLNGRRVTTVLENFNEPIRDHEVEGIAFIENDNKYIVALNVITGRRFELSF